MGVAPQPIVSVIFLSFSLVEEGVREWRLNMQEKKKRKEKSKQTSVCVNPHQSAAKTNRWTRFRP